MATAQERIEIEILADATKLKAGTDEAERSIEALADAVDTSSDQMRASLQSIDDGVTSTLGSGGTFSRSVDDVEAEGGRLKDVGSEVGAEFAANLQEGVASGDIKGSLLDTFSGLGAAAGATGQLGLAAAGVGVLLGATLIKGLSQAAAERKQEFVDEINGAFDAIEINAKSTFDSIRKQLMSAFDVQAVLTELGGEQGLVGGLEKVNEVARASGVPFNDIVDILRGKMNPDLKVAQQLLRDAGAEVAYQVRGHGANVDALTDEARLATDILEASKENRKQQDIVESGAQRLAGYYERTADAAERTAAALARINSRNVGDDLT